MKAWAVIRHSLNLDLSRLRHSEVGSLCLMVAIGLYCHQSPLVRSLVAGKLNLLA